jgi:predicted CxxxxCH...CXXCH cytochrome family protein
MVTKTLFLAALLSMLGALSACGDARPVTGSENAASVCTSCHGDADRLADDPLVRAAPPASITGRAGGAHLVHLRGSALRGPLACAECHDVPTSVQNSANHLNGNVDLTFRGLARANGAAPSFGDPTCSSVYCHGATLVDGPRTTPSWFAAGSVSCGSCHGAPPANHDPSSTNCNACHPGTVKPNGEIDVANGLHINGRIDVNRMHADGWRAREQHGFTANATGLARCKSCHGQDLGGGAVGVSCNACHERNGQAGWATNCTFCHGDRNTGRRSPPVDTQGRTDPALVTVGVHASHVGTTLTTPLACTECHPSHTTALDDPTHVDGDGRAEVVFGALARTGGTAATYTRLGPTDASCSSVYCHGAFPGGSQWKPSWTSTAQATCTSCHGAPPASGRHDKHRGLQCAECHGHAGSGPTHVNGTKNVPFSASAPGAAWSPATLGCGSFQCHGESHSSSRRWSGGGG